MRVFMQANSACISTAHLFVPVCIPVCRANSEETEDSGSEFDGQEEASSDSSSEEEAK